MVCSKCGQLRIYDPEKFLVCPVCENYCYVFTRDETLNKLKIQLKERVNMFFNYVSKFDLSETVLNLHQYRNNVFPQETFFSRYFSTTFAIGFILKFWDRISKTSRYVFDNRALEDMISMARSMYVDYHHMYFTNFDAVRLIKIHLSNIEGFKYTGYWLPYLKRAVLSGSIPRDGYFHSEKSFNLASARLYKDILQHELIIKNPKYEELSIG